MLSKGVCLGLWNDWFAKNVSQFDKKDLARAYVLVRRGDSAIKGYYALSNHRVVYEALPNDQAKGLPPIDIPVVLIGRLAVDLSAQGQRLGEFLLTDALRRAEYLAERIGIQAVEVDAVNQAAKRFYEQERTRHTPIVGTGSAVPYCMAN